VLEHETRRIVGVGSKLRHHADVALPREALDGLHLAELLRGFEPLAQIVIGKMRRRIGAKARGRTTTAGWRRHAVRLRVLLGHLALRYGFDPDASLIDIFVAADITPGSPAHKRKFALRLPRLRIAAPPYLRLCRATNTYIAKQFSAGVADA